MRLGVRRLIGWGLSLVLGTAALLQAAVPACGHHAVHDASGNHAPHAASAAAPTDVHAQHAVPLEHAVHVHHAPPVAPTPASPDTPSPCDCIDDCCATAIVAWSAPTHFTVSVVALQAPARLVPLSASVPTLARTHRQPPATAPPATRDV